MAVASLVYFNKIKEILEHAPELKRTAYGVGKQSQLLFEMASAAAGAGVGGLVGGPGGAVIGTMLGGVVGYANAEPYNDIFTVLGRLTEEEKYQLEQAVQEMVGSVGIESLVTWAQSEAHRLLLLDAVKAVANPA